MVQDEPLEQTHSPLHITTRDDDMRCASSQAAEGLASATRETAGEAEAGVACLGDGNGNVNGIASQVALDGATANRRRRRRRRCCRRRRRTLRQSLPPPFKFLLLLSSHWQGQFGRVSALRACSQQGTKHVGLGACKHYVSVVLVRPSHALLILSSLLAAFLGLNTNGVDRAGGMLFFAHGMWSGVAVRPASAWSGGGIGGLSIAVALRQYPHIDVEIFEAASELTEVGAGIGLLARPWKILEKLGVDNELRDVVCFIDRWQYRKSDRPVGIPFAALQTEGLLVTVHRADVQFALARSLPKSHRIFFSKKLSTYNERPESKDVELVFEDGTSATCDILVGADGVNSATRATLLSERAAGLRSLGQPEEATAAEACINPIFSGQLVFRALIPAERLRAVDAGHEGLVRPVQYVGEGAFILVYPVSAGTNINFVATIFDKEREDTEYAGPWVRNTDGEEVRGHFVGWEGGVRVLIDLLEKCLAWCIPLVRPLASFVSDSGRVALLGDAAHAMAPYQITGAASAIEDAYTLAALLGHATNSVPLNSAPAERAARALSVYDQIRRPVVEIAARRAKLHGRFVSFDGQPHSDSLGAAGGEDLDGWFAGMVKNWEWAWSESDEEQDTRSVESSVQEGIALLDRARGNCK
uniref:Salicylate hydroxylase n=1 Tax=Mycena chlorophos TaxID=658473 RepID=A0ABQ0LNG9_MYCCL|nr:salicylate hydroxylase [Mycena chlorophos]